MASLESGARTRATTIASTRSRSGERFVPSTWSSFSRRIIPSTAATCPYGSERSTRTDSAADTSFSPLSVRRSTSTASGGKAERLARVRLRILPPSREDSRRRTAGGEERLGTMSMYMSQI